MNFKLRQNVNRSGFIGPIGCIIFSLIGIAAIVFGIWFSIVGSKTNARCTEETVAVCQEYIEQKTYNSDSQYSDTVYYPVFNYQVDGAIYRITYNVGSSDKPYTIDEEVTIKYNPSNPIEIQVKGDNTNIILPIAIIGIGAIMIVGCVYSYKNYKKYENEPVNEHINESVTKIDQDNIEKSAN